MKSPVAAHVSKTNLFRTSKAAVTTRLLSTSLALRFADDFGTPYEDLGEKYFFNVLLLSWREEP